MDFGYFGLNVGALNNADSIERCVIACEQLGYESVWTGEHVVLIDPHEPPSPVPPESNFVDSIASLAFAAAKTERIKIGSGIILLAQRDPIVLAKELAGVDVLSKGRLLFGLGVGYVPGEFEALGIPYEERGARTTENIEVLRTLWTQEKPSFEGRFTTFSGIQSHPMPIQKPHPPIIVGGNSPPALRRAVSQGDGWYGFFMDVAAAAAMIGALEETAKSTERPDFLGRLTITITPPGPIDGDTAKRYEDLGVDRLVMMRGYQDMAGAAGGEVDDAIVKFLEDQARAFGIG
ncbi:MAG: LLM class F420-dependent oxidoreductase [bacterium]|nr:LLM class F420-dependent oxidoreductase [Deltaproteobacteria bacterium]MCP4904651.1 LLM class F420-dependent oxidoreductase [bacterium]